LPPKPDAFALSGGVRSQVGLVVVVNHYLPCLCYQTQSYYLLPFSLLSSYGCLSSRPSAVLMSPGTAALLANTHFLFNLFYSPQPVRVSFLSPVGCVDGIRNGGETGVDCGGACLPCPLLQPRLLSLAASATSTNGLACVVNARTGALEDCPLSGVGVTVTLTGENFGSSGARVASVCGTPPVHSFTSPSTVLTCQLRSGVSGGRWRKGSCYVFSALGARSICNIIYSRSTCNFPHYSARTSVCHRLGRRQLQCHESVVRNVADALSGGIVNAWVCNGRHGRIGAN
jgi:hypothetical protein